jgi:hypothetical protein
MFWYYFVVYPSVDKSSLRPFQRFLQYLKYPTCTIRHIRPDGQYNLALELPSLVRRLIYCYANNYQPSNTLRRDQTRDLSSVTLYMLLSLTVDIDAARSFQICRHDNNVTRHYGST